MVIAGSRHPQSVIENFCVENLSSRRKCDGVHSIYAITPSATLVARAFHDIHSTLIVSMASRGFLLRIDQAIEGSHVTRSPERGAVEAYDGGFRSAKRQLMRCRGCRIARSFGCAVEGALPPLEHGSDRTRSCARAHACAMPLMFAICSLITRYVLLCRARRAAAARGHGCASRRGAQCGAR